jgi:hypothetical protein
MASLNKHSSSHEPSQAWGADALSTFVDIAHANARRSFTYDRERCEALIEVDSLYRQVLSNLSGSADQLACSLLMRSHGLYLGAVSMALSGMIAESYGLLNRTLKTALQGVFVAGNSTRLRCTLTSGAARGRQKSRWMCDVSKLRIPPYLRAMAASWPAFPVDRSRSTAVPR